MNSNSSRKITVKRSTVRRSTDKRRRDNAANTALSANTTAFQMDLESRFYNHLTEQERDHFFSNKHVLPQRRAEIWTLQADVGQDLVNQYAWAVPNQQALKILQHYSPLVEMGCGANGYWIQECIKYNKQQQQQQHGTVKLLKNDDQNDKATHAIDIIGFDVNIKHGGKILDESETTNTTTTLSNINNAHAMALTSADQVNLKNRIRQGGPKMLAKSEYSNRTLVLCYPDDYEEFQSAEKNQPSQPLSLQCLQHYKGDIVIHIGELYSDTLQVAQAPWGRSTCPAFQKQLASTFHCILQVPLPGWINIRDTLSVWKRSVQCPIVFAPDSDTEDADEEEEESFRYIPPEEQLPQLRVAPCLEHLILGNNMRDGGENNENENNENGAVVPSRKKICRINTDTSIKSTSSMDVDTPPEERRRIMNMTSPFKHKHTGDKKKYKVVKKRKV